MERLRFNEDVFEPLLTTFRALRTDAEAELGDMSLNIAKAGFRAVDARAEWHPQYSEFILTRSSGELSDEALTPGFGDVAVTWRSFACAALGHLIGLYHCGRIDEVQFHQGDMLLPGFMLSHCPTICGFHEPQAE